MISQIAGTILERGDGRVVLQTAGVGYEVFVPQTVEATLGSETETLTLLTRLIWREDGPTLYGFTDAWEKRTFDLLLTVSGVGPKAALNLISALGADTLAQAVAQGDAKRLQSAPGIGAKTAQRICIDLADKLAEAALVRRADAVVRLTINDPVVEDAVAALGVMGFRPAEARAAVDSAFLALDEHPPVELVIKESLKHVKTKA